LGTFGVFGAVFKGSGATGSENSGSRRWPSAALTLKLKTKSIVPSSAKAVEIDGTKGLLKSELSLKALIKAATSANGFLLSATVLAFIEIFNLLRKFRPDILYLLSSEAGFIGSLAGSFYSLLFWRENLKIIYRIGGWAFKEPHNIFIKKIYLWSEKFSSVLKDIIIVNSEFDRQLAIKNKITKPNKITTIYNGISLNEIKFFLTEEAKKFINSKILYSKFYILNSILIGTIANLYKNKGLEFLVKTMSVIKGQMSNVTLMIIGDGPERKNLEKLIKKYKLKNNVFLLGAIPDAYKYLKALDLFVLPSIKEGQPWVILEAMAAEVPIVATNIAGIPEMIENGKSGLLVEPADPAALANAIEKMLAHPSLAQECIKNASIVVKEKFNITEMMEKNEKLF